MKRLVRAVLISSVALGLGIAPVTAQSFEGVVGLVMSTPTLANEATGYMKGQKLKIEPKATVQVEGIEGYPIIDFGAHKLYLISPKDKYYMTLPLSQLEGPIDRVSVAVRRSGRSDTMLGHPVSEWVLNDSTSPAQASIWATQDLHAAFNFFLSLQKMSPTEGLLLGRMAKAIIGQGWFPLAATARGANGAVAIDMHVVSIEARGLDDSVFAIPPGYGKMSDVLRDKR